MSTPLGRPPRRSGGLATGKWLAGLVLAVALGSWPASVGAQTPPVDLSQLSLEDLMNIQITSASRKEQRTADVAAAIFVITQEDIRRSGLNTIPDLLRLAPGVDVAQINGNKWAVSVRGFNSVYANKLLVLVDGRSIYSRIFAGVQWDIEELLVDDIDRIEVIRGPGAAMWGANAVNGVINIVTKSTAATQGGLVRVNAGTGGTLGAIRYGGKIGEASYRVFTQWTRRDESVIAPGIGADDASQNVAAGFRADWAVRSNAFMLDGGITAGEMRPLWPNFDPRTAATQPLSEGLSYAQSGHALGRWIRGTANGGSLQVQSFVSADGRQEPIGDSRQYTFDIDSQYHGSVGTRQDLVIGAGYRLIGDDGNAAVGLSLAPEAERASLVTAFIQDEIVFFARRVALTIGTQVQHEAYSGAGVQPSVRVLWKVRPRQRLWAAASRALRTPSRTERGITVTYPPVPTPAGLPLFVVVRGNPDARTETLVGMETGYRVELGPTASIDITGFVGHYGRLSTLEVAAPVVDLGPSPHVLVASSFGNLLDATTRGLEVSGHWAAVTGWTIDGSYSAFHITPHLDATSLDPLAGGADGAAPRTQWQVRTAFAPMPRATISAGLFHVGRLERLDIPSYTRADVRAEWRVNNRLAVIAVGQNLFDAAHAEFTGTDTPVLQTQVPRTVGLRLRWTFR